MSVTVNTARETILNFLANYKGNLKAADNLAFQERVKDIFSEDTDATAILERLQAVGAKVTLATETGYVDANKHSTGSIIFLSNDAGEDLIAMVATAPKSETDNCKITICGTEARTISLKFSDVKALSAIVNVVENIVPLNLKVLGSLKLTDIFRGKNNAFFQMEEKALLAVKPNNMVLFINEICTFVRTKADGKAGFSEPSIALESSQECRMIDQFRGFLIDYLLEKDIDYKKKVNKDDKVDYSEGKRLVEKIWGEKETVKTLDEVITAMKENNLLLSSNPIFINRKCPLRPGSILFFTKKLGVISELMIGIGYKQENNKFNIILLNDQAQSNTYINTQVVLYDSNSIIINKINNLELQDFELKYIGYLGDFFVDNVYKNELRPYLMENLVENITNPMDIEYLMNQTESLTSVSNPEVRLELNIKRAFIMSPATVKQPGELGGTQPSGGTAFMDLIESKSGKPYVSLTSIPRSISFKVLMTLHKDILRITDLKDGRDYNLELASIYNPIDLKSQTEILNPGYSLEVNIHELVHTYILKFFLTKYEWVYKYKNQELKGTVLEIASRITPFGDFQMCLIELLNKVSSFTSSYSRDEVKAYDNESLTTEFSTLEFPNLPNRIMTILKLKLYGNNEVTNWHHEIYYPNPYTRIPLLCLPALAKSTGNKFFPSKEFNDAAEAQRAMAVSNSKSYPTS